MLSADDHIYERFAPQTGAGRSSPSNGIRQFVVGTGGRSHYDLAGAQPNSEVRDNTAFGILRLELHAAGYDWRFIPAGGAAFTDVGGAGCH